MSNFKITNKRIHIGVNEQVQLVVRKHWFIIFKDLIGIVMFALVPIFLFSGMLFAGEATAVSVFMIALWLLIVWVIAFTVWTNYYLDIWVVTNKRIINVDQISLFNREVTTLRMERVQDVTIATHGLMATIFKFGTIRVQSAGAKNEFSVIHGIPDPEIVKSAILERVDMITEHTNVLKYNLDRKPTHST